MTTNDRANAIPRVADHVAAVRTDTGFVVAALRTSRLHALDGTAGAIWADIDGVATIGAIASHLAHRYGEERTMLFDAVSVFLDDLVEAGLVTFTAPPPNSMRTHAEDVAERAETGADGDLQPIGDVVTEHGRGDG